MSVRVTGGLAVAAATALVASGGALASTKHVKPVKHPTAKHHAGWKMRCKTVAEHSHGKVVKKDGKVVKHRKCTFHKISVKLKAGHGTGSSGTAGPRGPQGQQGGRGPQGPAGPQGAKGDHGTDGLNPAFPVLNVPSIGASSGKNPNPDSGDAGDGGFYYTGEGSGGSAAIEGGQLVLQGNGVDGNTWQGGIGVAKAYDNLPLSRLSALSYQWHVDTANGDQAPTIHITVMGATTDTKFKSSGFTNLTYQPYVSSQITPQTGVDYTADAFLGKWYSTDESSVSNTGGQDSPQPLSYFVQNDPNAVIVQISLDNGGTSGGSGTFVAGADGLIIGTGDSFTRYDFGG